jgi:DNA mismatch repair protein MutS
MQTSGVSIEQIASEGVKLTPMMEQYYQIKKQYPGIILFFRMGDFYEVFFEDAINTSKLLNISLTHRGKLGGYPIPMAGIPHHAAATYIDRLTQMGHKIAICEQVEDPKQAKGIVKRAVTQVASPGMPFDLDKSSKNEHSFICSVEEVNDEFFMSLIDYTTGDFFGVKANSFSELIEKLQIYRPKEFLSWHSQWEQYQDLTQTIDHMGAVHTRLDQAVFEDKNSKLYIQKLVPSYERDEVIKTNKGILGPISAIAHYICTTQSVEKISHIRPFRMMNNHKEMSISYPTLVGLEIFPKTRETYRQSLLGFMDATRSSLGARTLKSFFQAPLQDLESIKKRQSFTTKLMNDFNLVEDIRIELDQLRDVERILAKVSTGKVNGADLVNLAHAIDIYFALKKLFKGLEKDILPVLNKQEETQLKTLAETIQKTINDEIGATLEKGNLIKPGFNKKRDKLAKLNMGAAEAMLELETRYREETGIPNLKIKHNNVAGYFIEISKSHTNKVPNSFIRRQTLVNSERYQNEEIANFEKEMITAKEKLMHLEREIFNELVSSVEDIARLILTKAKYLGLADVFQSLAFVAFQENFSLPIIKNKKQMKVIQGWHPLIKANIQDQFVCHDLNLNDKNYFGLVTGPNMAGKTTVMREMAIIQFLAQLGSYVPAESAELGICDYIFSRLGAHDDIVRGQSTFMVEMSETAEILRHATSKSLIIIDEIGRGTSTYDGLSIAWSLVEYFSQKTKCITLFSTHYHELIELVDDLKFCKNLTVKTKNENGEVEFLYELIEKGATQSFGIHVAKLAGLPDEVLTRSQEVLSGLETNHSHNVPVAGKIHDNQLDMFDKVTFIEAPKKSIVEEKLNEIDLMNLTPIEAMNKLHELQSELLN